MAELRAPGAFRAHAEVLGGVLGRARSYDSFPSFMNNRKTPKRKVATPDLDPATLANVNLLKRQRQRMSRTLLKRRRQKSGQ
jgi:hypothetical protein